jgi:16S rRNA (cytosine967-C5)-methyltransferase
MYLHAYLRSAVIIIQLYDGTIPFASWLKGYFKQHKKFGSKDRKMISDLCYCYYRLGKAYMNVSIEERLLIGQFLVNVESVFIRELKPEWIEYSSLEPKEKIAFIGGLKNDFIFPFTAELSPEIDGDLFDLSFLIQPDLFLRVRPGNKKKVAEKLQAASIQFLIEEDCVRLPIASKIDEVLEIDKDVVVQDKSSQQVINPLQERLQNVSVSSWDCCAASGGKTILLHDHFPKVQLTVSDIRESILHNLRSRFKRAGIQQYRSFVADISSSQFSLNKKFDVIICDAPCSGSGTWGRTPEQLTFFEKKKIDHYAGLQKSIALNASKCLKEGGSFLYITCSVFAKENEEVVDHISEKTSLRLVKQQYFKGYTEKADTLFVALFLL